MVFDFDIEFAHFGFGLEEGLFFGLHILNLHILIIQFPDKDTDPRLKFFNFVSGHELLSVSLDRGDGALPLFVQFVEDGLELVTFFFGFLHSQHLYLRRILVSSSLHLRLQYDVSFRCQKLQLTLIFVLFKKQYVNFTLYLVQLKLKGLDFLIGFLADLVEFFEFVVVLTIHLIQVTLILLKLACEIIQPG